MQEYNQSDAQNPLGDNDSVFKQKTIDNFKEAANEVVRVNNSLTAISETLALITEDLDNKEDRLEEMESFVDRLVPRPLTIEVNELGTTLSITFQLDIIDINTSSISDIQITRTGEESTTIGLGTVTIDEVNARIVTIILTDTVFIDDIITITLPDGLVTNMLYLESKGLSELDVDNNSEVPVTTPEE